MGSYASLISSAVGGMSGGAGGSSAPEYKRSSTPAPNDPTLKPTPMAAAPPPAMNRSYVGSSEPQQAPAPAAPQWGQMISKLGNNGSSPFG